MVYKIKNQEEGGRIHQEEEEVQQREGRPSCPHHTANRLKAEAQIDLYKALDLDDDYHHVQGLHHHGPRVQQTSHERKNSGNGDCCGAGICI